MSKPGRFEYRRRARRRALQALYQWQMTAQDVGEILTQFRQEQDLSQVDEAFFAELVRGVAGSVAELDAVLVDILDRPLEQVDVMERVILRMGAWELAHQPGTPYRVVLDELVDLAHRFGDVVIRRIAKHQRRALPGAFDGVVQTVGNGE